MAPSRVVVVVVTVAAIVWPHDTFAWRLSSHALTALAAARALPPDVPEFLRAADEELAYICNDPDRWRALAPGEAPTLEAADFPNHWFQLERHPGPLPDTRYEFLTELVASGRLAPGKLRVLDFGTAPYAIAEYAEMLTETFRLWRAARPDSGEMTRRTRQIEQSAIRIAGLLCHYVTDIAQPLHASVHIFGWSRTEPNPRGFRPQNIHYDFEYFTDQCVLQRRITEQHILPDLNVPRPITNWLPYIVRQIRQSNAQVERVFELEQRGLLESCAVGSEAVTFATSRLAAATALLRDVWYAAWERSG
jgi:hypothetical protein